MSLEGVDVGGQPVGRAFAGAEPNHLVGLIQGHEVDLGARSIPETLDAMGQGEIPDSLAPALFIEAPREFLERLAFHFVQSAISGVDQGLNGSKVECPDRARERGQPGVEKVVRQVITGSPRRRLRKNGQLLIDQAIPIREDREIAADLFRLVVPGRTHMLLDLAVRTAVVGGDELEHNVLPTAQFLEKPILGLGAERRRALEEDPSQERGPFAAKHPLLVAVAIEFGHALEESPEE